MKEKTFIHVMSQACIPNHIICHLLATCRNIFLPMLPWNEVILNFAPLCSVILCKIMELFVSYKRVALLEFVILFFCVFVFIVFPCICKHIGYHKMLKPDCSFWQRENLLHMSGNNKINSLIKGLVWWFTCRLVVVCFRITRKSCSDVQGIFFFFLVLREGSVLFFLQFYSH